MKLLHRSAAAALLAPMLLFAISAWGFVGLRCRLTGMVSFETCCPAADGDTRELPGTPTSLDDPGCCERIVVDNTRPPAAGGSVAGESAPPRPVAVPSVAALRPLPLPRSGSAILRVDPPDRSGLSLRVLNRSLLI